MFGAFGLLALVLASVGLYGMLAYDVTQRTRELGVRMALGAQRSQVAGMIVGEGMRIAVIGVVIGVGIALSSAALVEPLLYDTSPRDPAIYGAVALVLVLVGLAASRFRVASAFFLGGFGFLGAMGIQTVSKWNARCKSV